MPLSRHQVASIFMLCRTGTATSNDRSGHRTTKLFMYFEVLIISSQESMIPQSAVRGLLILQSIRNNPTSGYSRPTLNPNVHGPQRRNKRPFLTSEMYSSAVLELVKSTNSSLFMSGSLAIYHVGKAYFCILSVYVQVNTTISLGIVLSYSGVCHILFTCRRALQILHLF